MHASPRSPQTMFIHCGTSRLLPQVRNRTSQQKPDNAMPFLPKDVVENCLGATQAQNRHLSYLCVYPLRLLRYTDLCSLSVFSRLSQCVSTYFTALPYTATTSRSIFSRQRGGKRELSRYFLAPIRYRFVGRNAAFYWV